jgi:selenocysteine lyase/cysteine desulfurase
MTIEEIINNESARLEAFPVVGERIFFGHAAVAPLPQASVDAVAEYCHRGARDMQETAWTTKVVADTRAEAAALIDCDPDEIALLGPTALGLSLVANGIDWQPGDEVVYYSDDYPANVYPWTSLERFGVNAVSVTPEMPGAITWETVERALTSKTRLVSLATCGFLTGYRIDFDTIGKHLKERGILFCLDGIQTVGAFPISMQHVDFLSADSHKWMLGPAGAGIVYIRRERFAELRPTLLGSWNVESPEFVAQRSITFPDNAIRYEPGTPNFPGIAGMRASFQLLHEMGIDNIGKRLLELRKALLEMLRPMGYRLYLEEWDTGPNATDDARSGIVTVFHPDKDMAQIGAYLLQNNVRISARQNRAGQPFVRFSPHFYNTNDEIDQIGRLLAEAP